MHTANKASGAIPRPSQNSPSPGRLPSKATPRVAHLADDLTQKILARLQGPVRKAALRALSSLGDETGARTWLDQQITRKVIEVAEQALVEASKITSTPSSAPASSRVSLTAKKSTVEGIGAAAESVRTKSPVPPSTMSLSAILQSSNKATQASKSQEGRSYRPPPPSGAPIDRTRDSHEPSSLDALIPPVAPPQEDLFQPLEPRLLGLKFCETASEGAEFLLDLILQVAPAGTALVHCVAPGSGEATVMAVRGAQAPVLKDWVSKVDDPILSQLATLRRPLRVLDPPQDARCARGRYKILAPQKHVFIAPALRERRLVGFIEVIDPLEGLRFMQNQADAVENLAHEWAKFLATRS